MYSPGGTVCLPEGIVHTIELKVNMLAGTQFSQRWPGNEAFDWLYFIDLVFRPRPFQIKESHWTEH
jgi:hypothetical protein